MDTDRRAGLWLPAVAIGLLLVSILGRVALVGAAASEYPSSATGLLGDFVVFGVGTFAACVVIAYAWLVPSRLRIRALLLSTPGREVVRASRSPELIQSLRELSEWPESEDNPVPFFFPVTFDADGLVLWRGFITPVPATVIPWDRIEGLEAIPRVDGHSRHARVALTVSGPSGSSVEIPIDVVRPVALGYLPLRGNELATLAARIRHARGAE